MDGLLTVQHDFNTYWLDEHMKHTNKSNKAHPQKKPRHVPFQVNPLWKKAFGGRADEED